jgi:twitching motility protein PilT
MTVALVDSLLTAIVRADGDALVMHVGEKPYVVAPAGPVELSTRPLTAEAMTSMLAQLLPVERQQHLEQDGAVEHVFAAANGGDRFTVVAARGGNDIWVEIRRHATSERAAERRASHEPQRPLPPVRPGGQPAGVIPPQKAVRESPAPPFDRQTPRPAAVTEPQSGVVVPMLRGAGRLEQTAVPSPAPPAGLDRLLRLAAARGASTLYIVAGARPLVRVDGDVGPLEGEGATGASDVEALLLEVAPEPIWDALRSGMVTEWICDVPEVGQVRCMSFRDHRGPGGIFRILPARALSADQLGLSREIQALCAYPDGLVVATGRRASGKSTLVSAFVDLINRTRSDHVITLETQIKFVHESRRSFVSQREVRGGTEEMVRAARAAMRENPDVLVLEDLGSADLVSVALEAAASGRLVVGAVSAANSLAALERLIEHFPRDRRPQVQHMLAACLRGIVAQALLRKAGGGRLAARELLLNTAAVASLIEDGKFAQLPLALDSGRRHGMVPLNDALAGFVQSGAADVREAYRAAVDRDGLLNLLKRAGVDTSFVERLA